MVYVQGRLIKNYALVGTFSNGLSMIWLRSAVALFPHVHSLVSHVFLLVRGQVILLGLGLTLIDVATVLALEARPGMLMGSIIRFGVNDDLLLFVEEGLVHFLGDYNWVVLQYNEILILARCMRDLLGGRFFSLHDSLLTTALRSDLDSVRRSILIGQGFFTFAKLGGRATSIGFVRTAFVRAFIRTTSLALAVDLRQLLCALRAFMRSTRYLILLVEDSTGAMGDHIDTLAVGV